MLRLVVALFVALPAVAMAEIPSSRMVDQERGPAHLLSETKLAGLFSGGSGQEGLEGVKIAYDRAWLDQQPLVKGDDDWACLAEALYFEARGESVKGQFAVAEVILNRVDSPQFPDTVCGVVNQGTGRKYACQFTYTCDGYKEVINEPRAYKRVSKVAKLMVNGASRDLTSGATYYHTRAVSPRWSNTFTRTVSIGHHHFYRPQTRVSLN